MFALDNLAQRVKAHASLEDCLVLMFQGIADEIVRSGTNQANLTGLVESLRAKDNVLAAAILKNLDHDVADVRMTEAAFFSEEARRLGRSQESFTEEEKARIRKDYATRPSFRQFTAPTTPYDDGRGQVAPTVAGDRPKGFNDRGQPAADHPPVQTSAPDLGASSANQGVGGINRGEDRSRVVPGPAPFGDGIVHEYGPASTARSSAPYQGREYRVTPGVSPTGIERRRPA